MQVNHFHKLIFTGEGINESDFNRISGPCPALSPEDWPKDANGNHLKHLLTFDSGQFNFNFRKYKHSVISLFYSADFYTAHGIRMVETERTESLKLNTTLPPNLHTEDDLLRLGVKFGLKKRETITLEQIQQALVEGEEYEEMWDLPIDELSNSIGGFPLFFQGDETPVLANNQKASFLLQFDLTHHEVFAHMFGGDFAVFIFNDENGNLHSVAQQ